MSLIAVTVIGRDRPGIIADVTEGLAALGLNLEDATMTLLRGHFAMMLICSGDGPASEVEQVLAPLTIDGLQVSVRLVPPDDGPEEPGRMPYVLTVHGGDRPGIVSALTRVVAEAGGTITDLATRLARELYVLVAEVDLPAEVDEDDLTARLRAAASDLGVDVTLRPQETDIL